MNITDITKQIRAFADQLEEQNKPAAPPFQLPPPPPGHPWHRTDGWKAEDLPPGTRPLANGETAQAQDQIKVDNQWHNNAYNVGMPMSDQHLRTRTTRPLVFTHEGKQWTCHRPGDPMPCDGGRKVEVLTLEYGSGAAIGERWNWESGQGVGTIIGWRYVEPATKEVELGPEDVPPGSVIKTSPGIQALILRLNKESVYILGRSGISYEVEFTELKDSWQINRSIPLTGRWNPDSWSPCHKTVPQNG